MQPISLLGGHFAGANSARVYGQEALYKMLEERPPETPLITVTNHHSCMDEPLLWGNQLVSLLFSLTLDSHISRHLESEALDQQLSHEVGSVCS